MRWRAAMPQTAGGRAPGRAMQVGGLCLALMLSPLASAQLLNGGFEEDGGSLDEWTVFHNVIPNVVADTTTPRSGSHVAKVFGGFDANPNYSGLFQGLPAAPGELWQAECFVRHNSSDPIAHPDTKLVMKIEFYRVFGGEWGTADFLHEIEIDVLDAGTPLDAWQQCTLEAVAPPETVEARLALVFIQHDDATGASLIDDVTFGPDDAPASPWQLIWQDEFDGDEVDLSKWRVLDIHLIKNNELQYYAPDDVYLEDGKLILRSQERSYWGYDEQGHWRHFDYTSGLVESINRFATTYGRVEVRAKLPWTQSIWPAHWMLSTSGTWPPEIDIMELLGHDPTRVYMTHHWGTWPDVESDGGSFAGPDFSQGFHTFAIEWSPDRIDWLVDGVQRFSSTDTIPQQPFYVILNTAVGGHWPGYPDETTVFPQYHEIDYVRVYVPSDPGEPLLTLEDATPTTAVADGVIEADEYVAATNGINNGLADRIGQNSVMHIDSSAEGRLNIAFESYNAWPTPGPFGAVIYIDAVDSGCASTVALTDTTDQLRRLVSGRGTDDERSDLYFALGFRADYAVCLAPESAAIYALAPDSLTLINGAELGAATDMFGGTEVQYHWDDGLTDYRVRELELRLDHIGVAQGAGFTFVVNMLDGDEAFRTNEFVGVALGNPWDGVFNPGQNDTVLKPGDFARFATAHRRGDFDGDGVVDGADFRVFIACLSGPDAVPAPPPPVEPTECELVFDFDDDSDNDLADYAALQVAADDPTALD